MGQLNATDGIKSLPKSLRLPTRLKLIYLFVVPLISMSFYDITYAGGSGWTFVFGIVVIMHVGFVLNNLRVSSSARRQWIFVLAVPIQVLIIGLWLGWSANIAFIHLYIFEILGMCVGLFVGTIFRKASITIAHRLVSIFLAAVFVFSVYYRFEKIFLIYLENINWIDWISLIIPAITASIPYILLFTFATEDKGDINMGTSPIVSKLSGAMGIFTLLYIFLPAVMRGIFG